MQYNELLARRIVAELARSSVDGGALQPVMLHEVARRLKINEASAEAAMYRAVVERWLIVEGISLYRTKSPCYRGGNKASPAAVRRIR